MGDLELVFVAEVINCYTFLFLLWQSLFPACDPYSCQPDDDYNIQLLSTVEANVENVDKTLDLTTQRDGSCAEAEVIFDTILENPFLNAIYKTENLTCKSAGSRR